MRTPELGSILLGTGNPRALLDWYSAAFGVEPDRYGWIRFGGVGLLIDGRDDVAARTAEPGRVVINFHTTDARTLAAHLDSVGVTWLVELEERKDGLFATLVDPDGNYLQIIELNETYLAARSAT